jgi:thioredoxin 1
MPFISEYQDAEPTRAEIDKSPSLVLLEFGANWCGHCQALSPAIEEQLRERADIRHVRVADGRGKPLGRSFRVKLWPTLVFLQDGQIKAQLVRPSPDEVRQTFESFGR